MATFSPQIFMLHLSRFSIVFYLLLTTLIGLSFESREAGHDTWDYLSVRYGFWYKPPLTREQAHDQGYVRRNSNCRTTKHVGFLFHRHGDLMVMPIYDSNGVIAGVQSKILGNTLGFNSLNESIPLPPSEMKPPFLEGRTNSHGTKMYTLTAYFKHPKVICNPNERRVSKSRGLYIQVGEDAEWNFIEIPLHSRYLHHKWTRTGCLPSMGHHYFMKFSTRMPCEKLYPVFIMYDNSGNLGAFGWSFQGSHVVQSGRNLSWFNLEPHQFPFLFGPVDLPVCMHNQKFRISGVRFFLKHHSTMTCNVPTRPQKRMSTDQSSVPSNFSVNVNQRFDNKLKLEVIGKYNVDNTNDSGNSLMIQVYVILICASFVILLLV